MQEAPAAELLEIRSLVAAFVEPHDLFLGLHPSAAAAGPSLCGCFLIFLNICGKREHTTSIDDILIVYIII